MKKKVQENILVDDLPGLRIGSRADSLEPKIL